MSEHAPTPLTVDGIMVRDAAGRCIATAYRGTCLSNKVYRVSPVEAVTNIKRIALTWNAHDALVAACEAALELPILRVKIERLKFKGAPEEKIQELFVREEQIEQQIVAALALVKTNPEKESPC